MNSTVKCVTCGHTCWTHGGDGRPRHKDCNLTGCVKPVSQTLDLLGVSDGQ